MKNILIFFFCLSVSTSFSQELAQLFQKDSFQNRCFAHRGGISKFPENTIENVLFQIEQGGRSFELDVQICKDSTFVFFHDDYLDRLLQCDSNSLLSDYSFSELSKFPFKDTSQGLIYISEFEKSLDLMIAKFKALRIDDFMIQLDYKIHGLNDQRNAQRLYEKLQFLGEKYGVNMLEHVFITSFHPKSLSLFRDIDTHLILGLSLISVSEESRFLARLAILFSNSIVKKYKLQLVEANYALIRKGFVRKWKKRNVLIIAYTINSEEEKRAIQSHKIAYTTDCPFSFCESVYD
jgi:glycerophosphoryl diester phosphodiesterase